MTKQIAWAVCNREGTPILWTIRDSKREAIAVWMQDHQMKFGNETDWKDSKRRLGTKIGCIEIKRIRDNTAELMSTAKELAVRLRTTGHEGLSEQEATQIADELERLADENERLKVSADDESRNYNHVPGKVVATGKLVLSPVDEAAAQTPKPACEPMSGEQLFRAWCEYRDSTEWSDTTGGCRDAWNALAAHIWPAPPPSRRDELRGQIVRTDHADNLTVLGLNGRHVVVNGAALWEWTSVDTTAGRGEARSKDEAIAAAESWLVDQAEQQLKGGA